MPTILLEGGTVGGWVPVQHKVSGASQKVSRAKYDEMSVSECWENCLLFHSWYKTPYG